MITPMVPVSCLLITQARYRERRVIAAVESAGQCSHRSIFCLLCLMDLSWGGLLRSGHLEHQ